MEACSPDVWANKLATHCNGARRRERLGDEGLGGVVVRSVGRLGIGAPLLACALTSALVAAPSASAQDVAPAPAPPPPTSASPVADGASGQAELPQVSTRVGRGHGFALTPDGRSRLHLGIDTGAGFDTNPYSAPLEEGVFAGDLVARIRPHADIDYPGSTVAFTGVALVDYGIIPGVVTPGTQNYLLYQSQLAGDLEVNRGGALRFGLGDNFSWNSDPGVVTIGSIFNRINNDLHAGVGVRPGGGALDFRLTYNFGFIKYFDIQGDQQAIAAGDLDQMNHVATLRADYKFLPKTGFFLTASGGYTSYPFSTVNPDAFPVAVLLGVQGQILAKLAGLASIGYSNPLVLDSGAVATGSLVGVVGQAELQWLPLPTSRMGVGFQRSFAPAALYQYLGNNRFYGSLSQLLSGRFMLNLNVGYSILEFGEEQINLTDRRTGRVDGHLDALVGISYFFTDWMSVGITNNFDWRSTNASDLSTGAPVNLSYIRNQTLLLASVLY